MKSFGVLDLGHDAVAPELAYVTARYAALVPFGKVAVLLSELLPINGAQNAGTIRNRTQRVGDSWRRGPGSGRSGARRALGADRRHDQQRLEQFLVRGSAEVQVGWSSWPGYAGRPR